MKIDNSRIFIGSVVTKIKENADNSIIDKKTNKSNEVKIETIEDVILVSFEVKNQGTRYVPVSQINNSFKFLTLSLASKSDFDDKRFLTVHQTDCSDTNLDTYVVSFERLIKEEGQTSLKDLLLMQNKFLVKDNRFNIIF